MRTPPYQLVSTIGSILLVGFVIAAYRFFPASIPGWAFTLAWIVAALTLLGTLTELYLLFREYRAGRLYPMRNASLFILLVTLAGLPAYLLYQSVAGQVPADGNLLLMPVILSFAVRNLFRVRVDPITLRAKTGFRPEVEVPLFTITDIDLQDDRITISSEGDRPIRLLRVFFFPRHWEALTRKLTAMRAS